MMVRGCSICRTLSTSIERDFSDKFFNRSTTFLLKKGDRSDSFDASDRSVIRSPSMMSFVTTCRLSSFVPLVRMDILKN